MEVDALKVRLLNELTKKDELLATVQVAEEDSEKQLSCHEGADFEPDSANQRKTNWVLVKNDGKE